jgi:hypothetical protein
MSYGSAYSPSSSEEPEYGTKAYDEEAAQDDGSDDPRKSNFPWWCFPGLRCFYHNIGKEIRDKNMRPTVYREYIIWYVAFAAYIANLTAEAYRFHKKAVFGSSAGVDLGISVAFLLLLWPATLFVYMLLYGAARDVGKSWTWWWLLMGLQICVELFFVIGIPRTGAAGLVTMIDAFRKHQKPVGFAQLATFFFWLFLFSIHLADYIILWRYRTKVEGGYAKHDNDDKEPGADKPIVKATKQKPAKKDKKVKKHTKKASSTTENANESSYQPPTPTTSSSATPYGTNTTPGDPNPSWHKPTGSAYDTGSSSKSSSTPSGTGSNPFGGDEGSLDDFYH